MEKKKYGQSITTVLVVLFGLFTVSACQKSANPLEEAGTDTLAEQLVEPEEHRATAAVCAVSPVPAEPSVPDTYPSDISCSRHADCTDGPNGRCLEYAAYDFDHDVDDLYYYHLCAYDFCYTDDDCGENLVCICGNQQSYCTNAGNCRVDTDCGKDGYCSPAYQYGGCENPLQLLGYFCRQSDDECVIDGDCKVCSEPGYCNPTKTNCAFNPLDGLWRCSEPFEQCTVG